MDLHHPTPGRKVSRLDVMGCGDSTRNGGLSWMVASTGRGALPDCDGTQPRSSLRNVSTTAASMVGPVKGGL